MSWCITASTFSKWNNSFVESGHTEDGCHAALQTLVG